jgi:hypothetical protein
MTSLRSASWTVLRGSSRNPDTSLAVNHRFSFKRSPALDARAHYFNLLAAREKNHDSIIF